MGDHYSPSFRVPLGIKQGGINSPDFFSLYIDVIKLLRSGGVGCHMYKIFLAIILFADDICLIAPTRASLQKMINDCSNYCEEYCLSFNRK